MHGQFRPLLTEGILAQDNRPVWPAIVQALPSLATFLVIVVVVITAQLKFNEHKAAEERAANEKEHFLLALKAGDYFAMIFPLYGQRFCSNFQEYHREGNTLIVLTKEPDGILHNDPIDPVSDAELALGKCSKDELATIKQEESLEKEMEASKARVERLHKVFSSLRAGDHYTLKLDTESFCKTFLRIDETQSGEDELVVATRTWEGKEDEDTFFGSPLEDVTPGCAKGMIPI
jgi:hypothetical protein